MPPFVARPGWHQNRISAPSGVATQRPHPPAYPVAFPAAFPVEHPQEINVEPVASQPHPPDDVALPVGKVIGQVGVAHLLQGGEIDLADSLFPDKPAQQVFHHLRVGEEQFIRVVVLGSIGTHAGNLAERGTVGKSDLISV